MSQELFNRFRTAKPAESRYPRIAAGQHLFTLINFEMKDTTENGKILAAEFYVDESTVHPVGSVVSTAWFVSAPSWKGEKEVGKAMVCVNTLMGAPVNDAGHFADASQKLVHETQPGRGLQIRAFGSVGKPSKTEIAKAQVENRKPEGFTEITWSQVTGQTPELKMQRRADIEAKGLAANRVSAQQAPAQPSGLLPLPPGWPAGAPIPPGYFDPHAVQTKPLPPGWPADAPVPAGYHR